MAERDRAAPGAGVEVRNGYDGRWAAGYTIAETVSLAGAECYRVRRCSDGRVLPVLFGGSDVRRVD